MADVVALAPSTSLLHESSSVFPATASKWAGAHIALSLSGHNSQPSVQDHFTGLRHQVPDATSPGSCTSILSRLSCANLFSDVSYNIALIDAD
jgi:hypothetical protein